MPSLGPLRERTVEQFATQRRVVERTDPKAHYWSRSNWPFHVGIIDSLPVLNHSRDLGFKMTGQGVNNVARSQHFALPASIASFSGVKHDRN